jgi:hypothetical protein
MFGPNTRRWPEDEVEEWARSRPTATAPLRGIAKTGKGGPGRPRKAAPIDSASAPALPKRPRGRPRKTASSDRDPSQQSIET